MPYEDTWMTEEEFFRALAGGDAADHMLANEPVRKATIHIEGTERQIRRVGVYLARNNINAQLIWAPPEGGAHAQEEIG